MRRAVDDERNQLYKFFYGAIKTNQPKFFIAENVRGILSLDGGNAIKQIIHDFENAGYVVTVTLVNVADYGVPQTRQRVFIFGQRKDMNSVMLFRFPEKTHGKNGVPKAWISIKAALDHYPDPDESNEYMNHIYSAYKLAYRNFTGHRVTDPDKPSPTILARGNGKGGVCAIPHYNGQRRLTIRESAAIQTFPDDYEFVGQMNSCYRQIGNAVPVKFAKFLGEELTRLERDNL
jgi:DNA (cytosine-5)-methyltransferase 1